MFDEQTTEFFHSGCAVLVGTVDPTGLPHASRGHGLTVLDGDRGLLRVLVEADDTRTLANLRPGELVAITTASVPTFRSIQLKGRVVLVEPATAADEAKRRQYTADFTHDIHETDGVPMEVLDRWATRAVMACVVEVDTSFDQTPGPAAGERMGGAPR